MSHPLPLAGALCVGLLAAGCVASPDGASIYGDPPPGDPDLPRDEPPEGADLDIPDDVVWEDDVGSVWFCEGEDDPAFCSHDYLQLAEAVTGPGFDFGACRAEIVEEAVELSNRVESKGPPYNLWTSDELADGIIRESGLATLHDLRPRNDLLYVRVLASKPDDGHSDHFLVIQDPLLGDVPARRLVPNSPGPHPAILVLPGHPSQPDATVEFADLQHGRYLAQQGFDVLILSPRAYVGRPEHNAATAMLCAGMSMVAVRHLEALLLKALLTSLEGRGIVQGIALMGHSGGAVQANALARWDHSFDALVTDHFWPYVDVGPCEDDDTEMCVPDSHAPRLLPYADAIESKDEPTPVLPTHVQEYGYPEPDAIVTFLTEVFAGE